MDKRGFIRTLEAIIAIIIVFVFIYVLMQGTINTATKGTESIKSLQEEVLRGISESEALRNCIVKLTPNYLDISEIPGLLDDDIICVADIKTYMQSNLGKFKQSYALVICNVDASCGIPSDLPDKNVYTTAIIITSSLQDYKPKIVRLWVW